MPTTSSNVTEIVNAVSNYSRLQVLDKLNELQLIVYATGAIQTEVIDPDTGMPPYLETTAGQKHYNLGADVRQTIAIFTKYARRGYSPHRDTNTRSVYDSYLYRSVTYWKMAVRSQDALQDAVANLTFVNDPGTTTERYYHRYVKKVTPLTSEDIQMDLPEHVHWIMREGVISLLSKENYGQVGKRRELIKQICMEVANELGKGAQGKSLRTPVQFEQLSLDGEYPGYH